MPFLNVAEPAGDEDCVTPVLPTSILMNRASWFFRNHRAKQNVQKLLMRFGCSVKCERETQRDCVIL